VSRNRKRAGIAAAVAAALGTSGVVVASVAWAAPAGVKVSVVKGSTAGGTAMTVTGTGFSNIDPAAADSVTFGGTNATSFIVMSDTSVSVVAPPHTAGSVDVRLKDRDGAVSSNTLTDDYRYVEPYGATVNDVKVSSLGGTRLDVTVGGVTSAADVSAKKLTATYNGAVAALTFKSVGVTTVTAPAGSIGFGKLVVSTDGVAAPVVGDKIRQVAVVSALSALTGRPAGGNVVTVTGKGFTDTGSDNVWKVGTETLTRVEVAPPAPGTYQVLSDTQVKIAMPASAIVDADGNPAPGAVNVTFTPDLGSDFHGLTSKSSYTYSVFG
jgi:hypothetical protein